MVKKCAYCNVYAESKQTKKVSYFSVKEKDRIKWSKALNIDLNTKSFICEKHFHESDITGNFTAQTSEGLILYSVSY